MTISAEIAASKQISLTTYRRDGTAVSTPVWHVVEGDTLVVVTEAASWKVRRIRNNPQVEVTACDFRGRLAPGAQPVAGTARLLDESGTERARMLLARRYIASRLGNWAARTLRIRRPPMIGIAITL